MGREVTKQTQTGSHTALSNVEVLWRLTAWIVGWSDAAAPPPFEVETVSRRGFKGADFLLEDFSVLLDLRLHRSSFSS